MIEQRMCLGTFSRRARSFTTYFLFARVRILPEAFCRIGKQFLYDKKAWASELPGKMAKHKFEMTNLLLMSAWQMSHTPGHILCLGEQHSTHTHTTHCFRRIISSHYVITPFYIFSFFKQILFGQRLASSLFIFVALAFVVLYIIPICLLCQYVF